MSSTHKKISGLTGRLRGCLGFMVRQEVARGVFIDVNSVEELRRLTESLIYDMTNGALLTNRTWNYKPPGAKDIPVDFRIRFVQTGENQVGVLRSKATGEPAMSMAVVVVFALLYALRSAQKEAGRPDDWISLESTMTPEHIFLSASNPCEQYTLK